MLFSPSAWLVPGLKGMVAAALAAAEAPGCVYETHRRAHAERLLQKLFRSLVAHPDCLEFCDNVSTLFVWVPMIGRWNFWD